MRIVRAAFGSRLCVESTSGLLFKTLNVTSNGLLSQLRDHQVKPVLLRPFSSDYRQIPASSSHSLNGQQLNKSRLYNGPLFKSILSRPSTSSSVQSKSPVLFHKRFVSYYGKSTDDEFLRWRSPNDSGLDYKPIGRWLISPIFMCYLILYAYLAVAVAYLWTADMTYNDISHVYVAPDGLFGSEFTMPLDAPSPKMLYNTIRLALIQSAQAQQGVQRSILDYILDNRPLMVIIGLCAANYLGKRFGPHGVRQFLIRYGYVRADVYAVAGGHQRYDAPFLSLLTSAFSHRNLGHLLFMTGAFSVLAAVVQQCSSKFNVITLFGGGTLAGAALSISLGTICAHAPVVTCGLGGAVAAMTGFLMAYFYAEEFWLILLALARESVFEHEEPKPEDDKTKHQVVVMPHFSPVDLRKAVAELAKSAKQKSDEDYYMPSDHAIMAVVNKSPIVKQMSDTVLPSPIESAAKQQDKQFVLQMMVMAPFMTLETMTMICSGAIVGLICVIGMFNRRVQNIRGFSLDYAAMVGGMAYGLYVGRQTRNKVKDSKNVIVAMRMPLMNDYLVNKPILAAHIEANEPMKTYALVKK
ncbi:hypothetical protein V1512DRAFT_263231 [Lipomyces arxii]|uniref:uncharacterized protein n=1 Tax=Lipomyces arxii TaxID=56418 RepID=UPI0034CE7026